MPRELTGAEEVAYNRYQAFGTPDEVQRIVQENEKLKTENAERRKQNKDLETERDTLKAAVPEGAAVLTGEDAKALEALKTAGVKLTDVPKVVEERDTLKTATAAREKRDALTQAVETEGWIPESVSVLHRLLGDAPLEVKQEDVEVTEGGKATKKKMPVGYVTVDGKAVRLSAWAEAEKLPATMFTARSGTAPSEAGGREWVSQRGSGGNGKQERTTDDHVKAVGSKVDYSV
jgi:hypothetical protein